MKTVDKLLLEIGVQIKTRFENQGFRCTVMRPWNNEYEISLSKQGDFDAIQEEIKSILVQFDFEHIDNPNAKADVGDNAYSFYANKKDGIGCFVDEEQHHVNFHSEFKSVPWQ